MKVTIHPHRLSGTIQAPASKSSMQRACAAALLAKGKTTLHNPGHSNDDKAAIGIIKNLGAVITLNGETIEIESNGISPVSNIIDCGESGLSIRMFTPIAGLSDQPITVTGSGSLVTRPMDFFDKILPQLQVKVKSNEGCLPLELCGPLTPSAIEVDGSLSSQFLTGLLMAYSSAINSGVATSATIKVKELKSKPYIDLTLDVMKKFDMPVPENRNYEEFVFSKETPFPSEKLTERNYTVEGDWSGGAFLLVAGAIAGPIKVRGLSMASTQADKTIVDALIAANAGIAIDSKEISLHPSALIAFDFDATDSPDLFPPLVTLAAYCKGISKIKGVSRLAHKESNRGITLQEEFGKMGITVELNDDLMLVHGEEVKGAVVHSHHDHRIAMACAVAALQAQGDTTIEDPQAVNKSYPDFYRDIKSLGANVRFPSFIL